ncbi:MAG TPA: TonB-dependent receptor [Hyphomonadaceae bacterium]|nr:TonB-dependent receptor [Hyphomonadaceae bacterium]
MAQSAPPSEAEVVVVTGTAVPTEYEKVGNSITVVREEQIEEQGYTNVGDVLRQVPGVAINRTGGFGGQTQVRIRGAEANHTVVLFNGVDVSDAGDGETDIVTLTSANVDRIEVLRGPQSGLYGSNALAGVINIITRQKFNGHYVNVGAEAGEFSTWRLSAGGGIGDGTNYIDGGAAAYDTEGFDISALGAALGPPGVDGDKEGANNQTAYVSGGYGLSPTFRVDGFARYVKTHGEGDGQGCCGGTVDGLWYDDASEFDTETYNVAGTGTLSLMDGNWVTVFGANYTHSTSDFNDHTPFGTFGSEGERKKYTLQSSYKFGAPDFISTVTGFAELKQEEDGIDFKNERELVGVGVNYAAEINDQLYLNATIRHDSNDMFDDDTTGGAAASWVLANSGTRLHASGGTGVTNPSFFEQFGFAPNSFIGNPDLTPEKAVGWDAGVEQQLLNGDLVVDVTYFQSTLEDEISFGSCTLPNPNAPPATLPSSCNQNGESDRKGVELSAAYQLSDTLSLIGSYTWLDATNPDGSKEIRRPENAATLDASWQVAPGFRLNLGAVYNGENFDTDFATFTPVKLDDYTLVRLGASYQLADTVELYGRVENATDEDYRENFGVLTPGTAFYVGFRLKQDMTH